MKVKKAVYIAVGFIAAALGAIGVAMPLLPAFPFFMLATYCFAKSSKKLYTWFTSTSAYKNNLESYVQGQGMTKKVKLRVMTGITLTMFFGFIMMGNVPIGRLILIGVWIGHLLYFAYKVKTKQESQKSNL